MSWQEENRWLSEQVAAQCAPLLAGLKPSNLLIIPEGLEMDLQDILQGTGVTAYLLSKYDKKQVYLLYRAEELLVYLTKPEVQELLWELGYEGGRLYLLLQEVSRKYTAHKQEKAEFPHELGLLLGYPAIDVRGFMEHAGKDFLYSGYWKVYGNVRETVSLFREFGRAKEAVMQMVAKGCSIADTQELYYRNRGCRLAVG